MRRSLTHNLRLAAILAGICAVGQTAPAGTVKMQPSLKITLHVYNWAHVDSETLNRAKQEATRIYREIGVETIWLDHSIDGPVLDAAPGVAEISVNIVPQATPGLGLLSNALGIAPGTGPHRGRLYVCYDRVESLYQKQIAAVSRGKTDWWSTRAQILGYAMAHEIGHLLGLDTHSKVGIMRAAWEPSDLVNLAFTSQQAAVIRTEVEMRQQAASAGTELQGQK
jgi:hypothetical protein